MLRVKVEVDNPRYNYVQYSLNENSKHLNKNTEQ